MEIDSVQDLVPSEPIDSTIVALTPAEMPAAQQSLIEWADRTVTQLEGEIKELEEHRQIAQANGWKLKAVVAQLSRAKRRIAYYQKIAAAVRAGYLILPNMPVDVFAVRVHRESPPTQEGDRWAQFRAEPELLPPSEGRYVGSTLTRVDASYTERIPGKEDKQIARFLSDEYTDVDFPVKAVKPIVLEATARAMGLKLFDQFGIVRDNGVRRQWPRRGDPIVVGQLIDPRGNGKGVTFFVAWWLDTSTL